MANFYSKLLYSLLIVFVGINFSITVNSCVDGTQYGKCSTVNVGKYCTGSISAPNLVLYVSKCPCTAVQGYTQEGSGDSATCVKSLVEPVLPTNLSDFEPAHAGIVGIREKYKAGEATCRILTGTGNSSCTSFTSCQTACYAVTSFCLPIALGSGAPFINAIWDFENDSSSLNLAYAHEEEAYVSLQQSTTRENLENYVASLERIKSAATNASLSPLYDGYSYCFKPDYALDNITSILLAAEAKSALCSSVDDCESWQICDAANRLCVSRQGYCTTNSECNTVYQQCDVPTHKCLVMTGYCTKASECKYDERCELDPLSSSAYRCIKAVCSTNNDCPNGFCDLVDHQCKSSPDGNQGGQSGSSCVDGTQYGKCSTVNIGYYCTGSTNSPSLQVYIAKCKCEAVSGWVQQGSGDAATCIQSTTYPQSKCTDGTPSNQCSPTKPKWCSNTVLVDNATKCGCPAGFTTNGNSCLELKPSCPKKTVNLCNVSNKTISYNVTYIFDRGYKTVVIETSPIQNKPAKTLKSHLKETTATLKRKGRLLGRQPYLLHPQP